MSQEVPGESILAALRRLEELERDEPIEYNLDRLQDCDIIAYYMEMAKWEDDKKENFIKGIQNQDVQNKLHERLEYIPVESDEDTVSYGVDNEFFSAEEEDDEFFSAEEEDDNEMDGTDEQKSAELDHPPLRI